MNKEDEKEKLFQEGMKQYKAMDYFEAHEAWEDLWSDYYLEDRKFVQGLIQLAVSFVHIGNGNMIGAKNLLKKCLGYPEYITATLDQRRMKKLLK